jgi:alanine-synthesizing transaminase
VEGLYESRKAYQSSAVDAQRYLKLVAPMGALLRVCRRESERLPDFDDQRFAMDLLEHKHVLVAPGTSFNVPYKTHFRVTKLPEPRVLRGTCSGASKSCSRTMRRVITPVSRSRPPLRCRSRPSVVL